MAKQLQIEHEMPPSYGSELDFREVYTAHFQLVWRMLLRLGVHERDVADVTQAVFLIVHRRLPEFEGRSKVSTWLTGICIRVARDWRSSSVVRREVLESEPAQHVRAPGDAHRSLELKQRTELAQQIVNALPEEQRLVFVLYEIQEMTGSEIGEAREIPLGTVRSRLRLARAGFGAAVARLRLGKEG